MEKSNDRLLMMEKGEVWKVLLKLGIPKLYLSYF